MPKTARGPWSAEDRELVREFYAHIPTGEIAEFTGRSTWSVYRLAAKMGIRKTEEYLASPEACTMRRGEAIGIAHRFRPGHVPANKGLRRPGYAPGRMARTQFKKGHRPHTWMPLGSTRLSKEGYLLRKMTDTGYCPRDWVPEHILLWTAAHGPPPPKHRVVFRDGDKTNIQLGNLELISMRELMARNTIHNLPKELAQVIQLSGALKRRLRRLSEKQDSGSSQSSLRDARSA